MLEPAPTACSCCTQAAPRPVNSVAHVACEHSCHPRTTRRQALSEDSKSISLAVTAKNFKVPPPPPHTPLIRGSSPRARPHLDRYPPAARHRVVRICSLTCALIIGRSLVTHISIWRARCRPRPGVCGRRPWRTWLPSARLRRGPCLGVRLCTASCMPGSDMSLLPPSQGPEFSCP